MAANSKRFLVIAETKETTSVRRTRPIFRKVFCPFCGAKTGLFRRDGDEIQADASHTLHCTERRGEIAANPALTELGEE